MTSDNENCNNLELKKTIKRKVHKSSKINSAKKIKVLDTEQNVKTGLSGAVQNLIRLMLERAQLEKEKEEKKKIK